ncbi:hypothetical protein [Aquimarina aggregata]|uniref:hypothetical protein n=1 Tax=Aquimarina aggregata TaxID=1642818 RepID=UPI0024929F43|nr:hypothetical protein [Aquimarina aggregata]
MRTGLKILLLLGLILFVSCSDSDDNPNPIVGGTTNSLWMLGDFEYTGGDASTNISSVTNTGVIAVSTLGQDNANGNYAGSSLSVTYSLNGGGTYTVVTAQELVTILDTDPAAKLVVISCTAGAQRVDPLASSKFDSDSASGDTVIVTVDNEGKYHFSTRSSITLNKTIDIGTGIPNAPNVIDFSMDDVFDFSK